MESHVQRADNAHLANELKMRERAARAWRQTLREYVCLRVWFRSGVARLEQQYVWLKFSMRNGRELSVRN